MATFNVDSLEFEDDEEIRVGGDGDYGFSYDSGNDALEIEDRVNTAIASIPRGTSTDLVGGKFAETVSEGKALADDGNVYDTIQGAVDNASSWVKVGPGTFNESVTIDTAGLTLEGCGERTVINSHSTNTIESNAVDNLYIKDMKVNNPNNTAIDITDSTGSVVDNVVIDFVDKFGIAVADASIVRNCTINLSKHQGIFAKLPSAIVVNCTVSNVSNIGINGSADDQIIAYCTVADCKRDGIEVSDSDSICYGNVVRNCETGIDGNIDFDTIVAKNRIINCDVGINNNNDGTGTILDSNLITE